MTEPDSRTKEETVLIVLYILAETSGEENSQEIIYTQGEIIAQVRKFMAERDIFLWADLLTGAVLEKICCETLRLKKIILGEDIGYVFSLSSIEEVCTRIFSGTVEDEFDFWEVWY